MHKSIPFAIVLIFTACSTTPPKPTSPVSQPVSQPVRQPARQPAPPVAEAKTASTPTQELSAGVDAYVEGKYAEAASSLNNALTRGLTGPGEQIKARKYLAFTYCVTNRKRQCQEQFGKILDLDPKFALEPNEAGHPLWGPVFRAAVQERSAKAADGKKPKPAKKAKSK